MWAFNWRDVLSSGELWEPWEKWGQWKNQITSDVQPFGGSSYWLAVLPSGSHQFNARPNPVHQRNTQSGELAKEEFGWRHVFGAAIGRLHWPHFSRRPHCSPFFGGRLAAFRSWPHLRNQTRFTSGVSATY
jgi:hypothetical protein